MTTPPEVPHRPGSQTNPQAPEELTDEVTDNAPVRLVNWLGFLLVGVVVNLLFLWGIQGSMGDASVAIWTKVLSWLPFNVIATAFYLVCYLKLSALVWRLLALVMIVANWLSFFNA